MQTTKVVWQRQHRTPFLLPWGGRDGHLIAYNVPWIPERPRSKHYLDQFSRFCTALPRETDWLIYWHHTTGSSVAISRESWLAAVVFDWRRWSMAACCCACCHLTNRPTILLNCLLYAYANLVTDETRIGQMRLRHQSSAMISFYHHHHHVIVRRFVCLWVCLSAYNSGTGRAIASKFSG